MTVEFRNNNSECSSAAQGFLMKNVIVTSSRIFLLMLLALCLGSCSACRDESPAGADGNLFNAPTTFIRVGLLRSPAGIAIDAEGSIWIADHNNDRLRKFSSAGIQIDSIILTRPSAVALDRSTRDHLVVVENGTTVSRFTIPGKTLTSSYPLNPFTGNSTTVLDVSINAVVSVGVTVHRLGDIDTSPTGDVYVSAQGSPANSVIRISPSGIFALAASPVDSINALARFLAVDGFGSVYTAFSVYRGPAVYSTVYVLTPGNIAQSRAMNSIAVSRMTQGATTDPAGRLYIADGETQEVIIAATASEVVITRYRVPDTDGFSMAPRDVALAADGTMYVVVADRLGTEAGAVLRYTPVSQ